MKLKAIIYQNPIGYIASVVFLAFSIVMFNYDKRAALSAFVAFILILSLSCIYSFFNIRSTQKYVGEINKSLKLEQTDEVNAFPLPGVLCDPYGNIVWYNDMFGKEILVGKSSKALNVLDFFEDFPFSEITQVNTVNTKFGGRYFTVFVAAINSNSSPLISLYFLDDTYYKTTEREYNLTRPFVMLVMIDNIEMMSRQFSDSKFALVTSGIEGRIEKWIKDENLIFKKTSNGRFLIIGEKRSLDTLCEHKFSVLASVREYKYNNTAVNATLSIGVGTGAHFSECEEKAKKALDMALGRGGDQAALFTDNGYVYYGGMSNITNDNSRVSPRQTSANISNMIKNFEKVVIVGHRFSDYDAIGSALGMLFLAQSNGVEARVVVDEAKTLSGPLIKYVRDAGYKLFISTDDAIRLCDQKTLLIVVDTHRAALLECPELSEKAGAKIVVDHHRRMEDFISDAAIFYHLPSPSSTCEMVAELIEYSAIQESLPPIIATALLSGIVLDTKDYVLRTSQRTFEAAAYLRKSGADTVAVRRLFAVEGESVVLKNEIIASGEMYGSAMIAKTEHNDNSLRVVSSKAADEMLNIEGVKLSFVLANLSGSVNISARSLGEENVQLIMEKLGGGGHSTMAAAQLTDVTLSEAVDMLKKAIDEYNNEK